MTIQDREDELAKVLRALKALHKLNLHLFPQKGLYCVIDGVGVPQGAPFEVTIDEVLAWADLDQPTRDRLEVESREAFNKSLGLDSSIKLQ